MSARSADSRDNSPDGEEPVKRASRKRKVLSCYACRERKMRCDRVYPVCGRCQRNGRAAQCTYDPRLVQELAPPSNEAPADAGHAPDKTSSEHAEPANAESASVTWQLRVQERRLEMMEKRLTSLDTAKNPSPVPSAQHAAAHPEEPQIQDEMMFRGKSFKTQLYGATCPLSVVTKFAELQAFTRQSLLLDASLIRLRKVFKAVRLRKKADQEARLRQIQGADDEIYALVPEKGVVDEQVSLYFRTWETSYRIMHESTFWRDYAAFWNEELDAGTQVKFATILVLMVAISQCLSPKEDNEFFGDSSVDRESAYEMVEKCEAWLQRQSRKHLTLHFFQVQCLLLVAKRVNCLQMKQEWVNTGEVVRLAIGAGLHRNPALLSGGQISEFETEMRRRLWVTIAELELQASMDTGLQSSVCGLFYDIQPPANIPDDAFSVDSQQIPSGRLHDFTPTSYLTVTLKSMPLRSHLVQLLNNPTSDIQYSDVLHYSAQINAALSALPTWEDPRAAIPSALLRFQLRQFLIVLHRPYAKRAAKEKRYAYSFTTLVDAVNAFVADYDSLNQKGILAMNHFRNDLLRVGIALSQVVYHNCVFSSQSVLPIPSFRSLHPDNTDRGNPNYPEKYPLIPGAELRVTELPTSDFLANTLCSTSVSLVDRIRQLYELKVIRLGTGYMEYWLLSAAVGILPPAPPGQPATSIASITNPPDDIRSRGKKALERINALCFRVMGLQNDQGSAFTSSLRQSMSSSQDPLPPPAPMSNSAAASQTPFGEASMASFLTGAHVDGKDVDAAGQGPFDGLQDMQMDMAGWTFPDYWSFDIGGTF